MKLAFALSAAILAALPAASLAGPSPEQPPTQIGMVASVDIPVLVPTSRERMKAAAPQSFDIHPADAQPLPGTGCCNMPADAVAY